MNELALFAGAGGGILGGHLLGWRTVCAVEFNAYARSVLLARQNDGTLPPFPIWDDVRTFDGRPWRGGVDVVSGGFPCQDISVAGKGEGLDGERSGLWSEMARIIGEVRPRFAFVENSPMLAGRGLGDVLGDLAALGFDAEWGVLGAGDIGAPHQRDRLWIAAAARPEPAWEPCQCCDEFWCNVHGMHAFECDCPPIDEWTSDPYSIPNPGGSGLPASERKELYGAGRGKEGRAVAECGWWSSEPAMGRVANGLAHRVDRLKAIGNGQVPGVAAAAWRILTGAA